MFCSKCGTSLPDESAFCFKCGWQIQIDEPNEIDDTIEAPKPQARSHFQDLQRIALIFAGLLLLFLAANLIIRAIQEHTDKVAEVKTSDFKNTLVPVLVATATPTPRPTPYWVSDRKLIVQDAVAIGPGKFQWYDFTINKRWRNARLLGHFEAQGGGGNDVVVTVTDDDGLVNYQNGHGYSQWYDSGRATVGTVERVLPPGNFHLIVSNTFSVFAHKSARLEFAIEYEYLRQPE